MNRLWRICDRTGLAPVLRTTYFTLRAAPRRWRYRATVGGVSAEFRTSTWYEFKRARHLHGERRVIESFLADIADDEVVWDVGANVGMYACFAAKKLSSGTVVGFEPIPVNRERLEENLLANAPESRWLTSPYPLSDADEPASMAFGHHPSKRLEPGAGHHYLADDGDEAGWITVDCRRGETLVAEGLPAPDVVKIDVQGAELKVLRGMGAALDGVRSVYVEIHPEKSKRYATTAEEIERFLRDEGFVLTPLGVPGTYRHGVYHVLASRWEGEEGEVRVRTTTDASGSARSARSANL